MGDGAEMLWLEPLLLCTRDDELATPWPAEARRVGPGMADACVLGLGIWRAKGERV